MTRAARRGQVFTVFYLVRYRLLAATEDRDYKVELRLDGDETKGTLTSGTRIDQLVVKRRKQ